MALDAQKPESFVAYADYLARQGSDPQGPDVRGLMAKAAELGDPMAARWVVRDRIVSAKSPEELRPVVDELIAKGAAGDQSALLLLADNAELVSVSGQSLSNRENWLRQAVQLGNIEAQGELGWLYIQEGGAQGDTLEVASQLIQASARAGYPGAIVALAHPALSPDVSSAERYSIALSGYELSQGLQKRKFEQIKEIACKKSGTVSDCEPVPVFYFTNRAAELEETGKVSYLNRLSKELGNNTFGIAYAFPPADTTQTVENSTENWWNVLFSSAQEAFRITYIRKKIDEWYNSPENARTNFSVEAELSPQAEQDFVKQIKKIADQWGRQKALIYVHGFSNSFDGAVERMALISKQYNYPAVPIVFSWASANRPLASVEAFAEGDIGMGYINDHRVVRASCETFQRTLSSIVDEFGDGNVMILAHSMGGELTMDMLTSCSGGQRWESQGKLGPVIFAAPDIDRNEFEKTAPRIAQMTSTTVLYASSNDIALALSRQFNVDGAARAGEGGNRVLVVPPVQTIDASSVERLVDTDSRNHSYVFDARQVRKDLVAVLRDVPLHQRDCISLPDGSRPQESRASNYNNYFVIQTTCD